MKKVFLSLFLLFCFQFLSGQPVWSTMISDDDVGPLNSHKKMIKTDDGNFIVLFTGVLTSVKFLFFKM